MQHLTLPLWQWGEPASPSGWGPYVGGEVELLIATEPTQTDTKAQRAQSMESSTAEIGLELDVGALQLAKTPFPLLAGRRNPLPRWLFRVGYTRAWVGHGTAKHGYLGAFGMAWSPPPARASAGLALSRWPPKAYRIADRTRS